MARPSRTVQYLITLCVSLAFVVLGVTSAWPTPVQTKFHDNETNVDISDNEISWMLGIGPIGFTLGSVSSRFVTDSLGRRTTILGSAIPVVIGTIIVSFAQKAWLLYIMMFTWSFGTGMLVNVNGMYLAEVMDKDIRGTLTVVTKVMFNFGNLLIMTIGPRISYQTLNFCILTLPVGYFLVCWWIPESPYYYLKEGREDLARRELVKIQGGRVSQELEDELKRKKEDVANEMARSSSIKELFVGRQYRRAVIIASGLKLTQVLTGGTTIKNYLGRIMRDSNIPKEQDSTVFLIFGAITFFVGVLSSALVDRVGRRPLLIYSYFGTGICLAIVGIYFFLLEVIHVDITAMSFYVYVPFIAIILSNVISTLGFNTIVALVIAEIFPLNVKTIAITLINVFGGCLGFVVAKSYQNIKDSLGSCTLFWIYTLISIIGGVFSYFMIPETKGKDLREIQIILQGTDGGVKLDQIVSKEFNGGDDGTNIELLTISRNKEI